MLQVCAGNQAMMCLYHISQHYEQAHSVVLPAAALTALTLDSARCSSHSSRARTSSQDSPRRSGLHVVGSK